MKRSLFRRLFSLKNGVWLFTALSLALIALLAAKASWDRHAFEGYDPDLPLEAKILSSETVNGSVFEKIEMTGLAEDRFPFQMVRPEQGEKIPCIVFLYGIGQNLRFFKEIAPIFGEQGIAMLMPEQFDCGERRVKAGAVRKALNLRERSSRIVPETRRIVDFLHQQPQIDPERIYLIGASYGGITGCSVLAHEPRFSKAVLVMAGGDLPRLLDSLARERMPDSRVLVPTAAHLIAWLFQPFEPLDYVTQISPRPLLFLNISGDDLIASESLEILYETAKEPKALKTYEGSHRSISEKTVREMLNDAVDWLQN